MREKIIEEIKIPEGVECSLTDGIFKCKKGDVELKREISLPRTKMDISKEKITFVCEKGNKKNRAIVKSFRIHVENMFKGLEDKFTYELEICHVHFPMTVKVESEEIVIDNFLGEKFKRRAKILPGVEVEVKGNKINVSGHDVETAGQTAANIEKAARVREKDRRIFQDGIFITNKRGRKI